MDCGTNITDSSNGVITSPGYPDSYMPHRQVCSWFISVRPHHKILLLFMFFLIEGDQERRGCPGAVVRVYPELGKPPIELCGETLSNETKQVISSSNIMKVTFVTADKAVGAKGFNASWTEVKEGSICDELQCAENGYCIASVSRCNGIPNCGLDDDTDEHGCRGSGGVDFHLVVGLALGGAVITVITMCAIFHRKCKRRREPSSHSDPRQKHPPTMPTISSMSDTV